MNTKFNDVRGAEVEEASHFEGASDFEPAHLENPPSGFTMCHSISFEKVSKTYVDSDRLVVIRIAFFKTAFITLKNLKACSKDEISSLPLKLLHHDSNVHCQLRGCVAELFNLGVGGELLRVGDVSVIGVLEGVDF